MLAARLAWVQERHPSFTVYTASNEVTGAIFSIESHGRQAWSLFEDSAHLGVFRTLKDAKSAAENV